MEKKLLEELNRYNQINGYVKRLINEQDAPADPNALPDAAPDMGAVPPPAETPAPEAAPAETPTADDTTEEIDITDLVNMTKSIKKELEERKPDNSGIEKMDGIFSKLTELETKLQAMDELITKIDGLTAEVKASRPKTPEEKLEMRSLDSYPFTETPKTFFQDKLQQMRDSGKNEYVLTKDEIENYNPNDLKKSFNPNL